MKILLKNHEQTSVMYSIFWHWH